ncbi:hypothetical protein OF820_12745 [Oceanotoga sp. DSM 15011]|jgi:hypothetical protein|uniref:putative Se/S carrier-like protein n=1 Tax=Oceanotoga TaxID=1255275 RepID=UPI0021F49436|nr:MULTISPECIES: putative Se/S carrier-like protein [Oceanotoga]MDO7975590.1 hypothetical protein [Oceanotoga teriensis]UYO99904.1 hypothetical protein OF820_12745 [Oceanotoga sp. DSM 15011]
MTELRTTLDINMVILIKNYEIIYVKDLLKNNNIFSKIFPAPKTVLEVCAPVLTASSKDEKIIINILEENGIIFEIKKLDKDIIWELLKR